MTTAAQEEPTSSRWIAAELRAEIARAGTTMRQVAMLLGIEQAWISRRLSPAASGAVNLTFEDLEMIAAAIGVDVEAVMVNALRARRDSNPQPSDLEPVVLRLINGPRVPSPSTGTRPSLTLAWSVQPGFTPERRTA